MISRMAQGQGLIFDCYFSSQLGVWKPLPETELKRDAPLKNLYQKAQASLVFSLFSKLPSSKTHPLNTLKDKYLSPTIDSDMGLRMYILVLLSRMFNHDREGLVYLKQVQLARLAELLFIAFEIHGCILEPSA